MVSWSGFNFEFRSNLNILFFFIFQSLKDFSKISKLGLNGCSKQYLMVRDKKVEAESNWTVKTVKTIKHWFHGSSQFKLNHCQLLVTTHLQVHENVSHYSSCKKIVDIKRCYSLPISVPKAVFDLQLFRGQ